MPTDPETRRVKDLKTPFFVRIASIPERLEYFRRLRASGSPFPPLTITAENEVLDGRHRLAVAAERGEPTVPVTVVAAADEATKITLAAAANANGAQPMTMKDLAHTAELLLTAGLTQKDAIERLATFLPERFVAQVIGELRHARRHRAVFAALRELRAHPELSLKALAEKHGVTPADLQNRLDRHAEAKVVPTRTAELTKAFGSASSRMAKFLGKLFEDYTEGLTEARAIDAALDAYDQALRSATVTYRQWIKRWAALRQTQKKAASR